MPHSQISFKSWFDNADSEFYFFFQNKCYSDWIKKLVSRFSFNYFNFEPHSIYFTRISLVLSQKKIEPTLKTDFKIWRQFFF